MNVLPIAIIGLVAALLAFDKRYEDGLVRHVSLAAMVICSIIICGYQWWGGGYKFSFEVLMIFWAWAVFFVCHAISFIRWRLSGSGDWSKQEKASD